MKPKPVLRDLVWVAAGTILLVVPMLLALHYRRDAGALTRIADRARRLDLVAQARTAFVSAAEAEKSAVMATSDRESQEFAAQSRAASDAAEARRAELAQLLAADGTGEERALVAEVTRALAACRHIDEEILDLSVKNSNLKAYDLAFGPAADALAAMDAALSRIIGQNAAPAPVLRAAAGAQSAAWRIQALLPPHIAAEGGPRMDELESRMADEDHRVRAGLAKLTEQLGAANTDLAAAATAYARYGETQARVLDLSRQNTNVRSLVMSLNQKRQAVQACLAALDALERSIRGEPPLARRPESPR